MGTQITAAIAVNREDIAWAKALLAKLELGPGKREFVKHSEEDAQQADGTVFSLSLETCDNGLQLLDRIPEVRP